MIRRSAETRVQAALSDTPVVLIHGARQVGKSTLAHSVSRFDDRRLVTLDDLDVRGMAKSEPAEFLRAYPPPLTIDEVQRAPELFLPLKAAVDRNRKAGAYLLTGSANVLSLPRMADSLAGRMEVVELFPLSQAEIEGSAGDFLDEAFSDSFDPWGYGKVVESLVDRIVAGGFPEPLGRSGERREAWFKSYVRTLLERDVRDLSNIEGLTQLPRVLAHVAATGGASLNVNAMSRQLAIAHTTLTRYLDLLKALFIVQTVPAWSLDATVRLTKTPKAYLLDTGLRCALQGIRARDLGAREVLPDVLENFVATELTKACSRSGSLELYHLRTVKQKEVDFVIECPRGGILGIDVRASETVSASDAEGLAFLAGLAGESFTRGIVLYLGQEVRPLSSKIWALPICALWE